MSNSDVLREEDILSLVEHYLGDKNLAKDEFTMDILKNNDGWITISKLISYPKLHSITTDAQEVFNILKKSKVLQVDDQPEFRVKRITPFTGITSAKGELFRTVDEKDLIDAAGVEEDEFTKEFEETYSNEKYVKSALAKLRGLSTSSDEHESSSSTSSSSKDVITSDSFGFDMFVQSPVYLPRGYELYTGDGSVLKRVLIPGAQIATPPESSAIKTSELFTAKAFRCQFSDPRMPTPFSEVFIHLTEFFTSSRRLIFTIGKDEVVKYVQPPRHFDKNSSSSSSSSSVSMSTSAGYLGKPIRGSDCITELIMQLVEGMRKGEESLFIVSPSLAYESIGNGGEYPEEERDKWITFKIKLVDWIPHIGVLTEPDSTMKKEKKESEENSEDVASSSSSSDPSDPSHSSDNDFVPSVVLPKDITLRDALIAARVEKDAGNKQIDTAPRKALASYYKAMRMFDNWELWCGDEWKEYYDKIKKLRKERNEYYKLQRERTKEEEQDEDKQKNDKDEATESKANQMQKPLHPKDLPTPEKTELYHSVQECVCAAKEVILTNVAVCCVKLAKVVEEFKETPIEKGIKACTEALGLRYLRQRYRMKALHNRQLLYAMVDRDEEAKADMEEMLKVDSTLMMKEDFHRCWMNVKGKLEGTIPKEKEKNKDHKEEGVWKTEEGWEEESKK